MLGLSPKKKKKDTNDDRLCDNFILINLLF